MSLSSLRQDIYSSRITKVRIVLPYWCQGIGEQKIGLVCSIVLGIFNDVVKLNSFIYPTFLVAQGEESIVAVYDHTAIVNHSKLILSSNTEPK